MMAFSPNISPYLNSRQVFLILRIWMPSTTANQHEVMLMKLKCAQVILLPLLLIAGSALAAADSVSHRQAVIKLLELTDMQLKIETSVDNVLALQLNQNPEMHQHEALLREFLQRNIGWDAMKEDLIGMYMQSFTEAELEAINTFYASPTGRKLIDRLPELIKQRDQLAMQRMQENIGELQQEIAKSNNSE